MTQLTKSIKFKKQILTYAFFLKLQLQKMVKIIKQLLLFFKIFLPIKQVLIKTILKDFGNIKRRQVHYLNLDFIDCHLMTLSCVLLKLQLVHLHLTNPLRLVKLIDGCRQWKFVHQMRNRWVNRLLQLLNNVVHIKLCNDLVN